MIIYVGNKTVKKFLEIISNYCKVPVYKVNIQKLITLLYTSNEKMEFEVKNTIPFTLAPPKMKCLVINLTKYL